MSKELTYKDRAYNTYLGLVPQLTADNAAQFYNKMAYELDELSPDKFEIKREFFDTAGLYLEGMIEAATVAGVPFDLKERAQKAMQSLVDNQATAGEALGLASMAVRAISLVPKEDFKPDEVVPLIQVMQQLPEMTKHRSFAMVVLKNTVETAGTQEGYFDAALSLVDKLFPDGKRFVKWPGCLIGFYEKLAEQCPEQSEILAERAKAAENLRFMAGPEKFRLAARWRRDGKDA